MRIAIFTDTFSPDVNGVANTLENYLTYLEQSEHEYLFITPEKQFSEKTTNQSISHSFISIPFFLYPEYRIHVPKTSQIKTAIKAFQPDIIHVVTPFTIGLYGIKCAKKYNIPLVGSYHTNFDQYLNYYHFQFLSKTIWNYLLKTYQPMDRVFVPSVHTMNLLRTKGFKQLRLWSRGVDTNLFQPIISNNNVRATYQIHAPYILTYTGRLSSEKNIDRLLALMQSETLKAYDIHWLIVGDGPQKTDMESYGFRNVSYTGFVTKKELAKIYAASDLFVFPSATETFGNVVLEAFASGLPVIGATQGAVNELINDGRRGIACNPDDTEDFVKGISSLLYHPMKRKQMGKNARNFALKKSWNQIFDQLLEDYYVVMYHHYNHTKRA